MLLSLRNDHKQHLELLTTQSTQVVVDFCKLAIDYIQKGPSENVYKIAAKRLEVDADTVQNCVHGLVHLLVLACKHKLSEADFRDSIRTLGFGAEHEAILNEFYKTKGEQVHGALEKLVAHEEHYVNLEWRFEVQVASRSLPHQVNPLIALDVGLQTNQDEEVKSVLLQTDPTNLMQIAHKLKTALAESRTRYSRKIQNTFLE